MHSEAGKALQARARAAFADVPVRFGPTGARGAARRRAGIKSSGQRVALIEKRRRAGTNVVERFFSGVNTLAKAGVLPGLGMAGRGMQLQAIGRQQLARVPSAAKVGAAVGGSLGAAFAYESITGRSPARTVFEAGRGLFNELGRSERGIRSQRSVRMPTSTNGQHTVVRTWQTFPGGPVFARFSDGHIEVQKKDGTIKHFRPYRPVVIPRRWNARSMSRVATALKRQRKTATKILQITGGVPKRTVRVASTPHRSVDV